MSEGDIYYRVRYIPVAIRNAERKLAQLYREAESYRMKDILSDCRFYNEAWDREVKIAKLHNEVDDLRNEREAIRNAA